MILLFRKTTIYLLISVSYIGIAHADKVFTWKDEKGNIHFGDKALNNKAQEITIKPTSVGDPSAQQRAERNKKYLDALSEDREERTQAREKAKLEELERAKECAEAKKSYKKVTEAQFVYTKSDTGEKIILDFEQRAAAEQKAKNKVREFCGNNELSKL